MWVVKGDEECERGRCEGEEPGAGFGAEGLGDASDGEVGGGEVAVVVVGVGGGGGGVGGGPADEVASVEEVVVDVGAEFGGEGDEGAEGGWGVGEGVC